MKYCMCNTNACNSLDVSINSLSMRSQDFIFPFDNSSRVARVGKQRRLQCYTCGSLFNRDSPACAAFNPADPAQITTCNEGEACMLYTWRKSRTEIGEPFCYYRRSHAYFCKPRVPFPKGQVKIQEGDCHNTIQVYLE